MCKRHIRMCMRHILNVYWSYKLCSYVIFSICMVIFLMCMDQNKRACFIFFSHIGHIFNMLGPNLLCTSVKFLIGTVCFLKVYLVIILIFLGCFGHILNMHGSYYLCVWGHILMNTCMMNKGWLLFRGDH